MNTKNQENKMLNIKTSALVIIDVQEKLINATKNVNNYVVQNMAKMSKVAEILNIPTIITEQYPKGLGNTSSEISVSNADVIEKASFSALLEPDFAEEIQSLNKKQIIIGGIETHICVLQTVADLISEGYEVYVLKDCCSSRNKMEYNTGLELMKQYGAKISCLEIALFELLKTSKHPNFKEIQNLIK
jgi:nicotinamidase-related amidase